MNRKNTLLFLLAVFLSQSVNCQTLNAGFTTGVGFYRMKYLKAYNSALLNSLAFEPQVIADYPPFFYYEPSLTLSFDKFSAGILTSYNSTGSRISLKDYSGEYLYDTKIRSISPGFYVDYSDFDFSRKFSLTLYAKLGMIFSRLETKSELNVFDMTIDSIETLYRSQSFYAEPGMRLNYDISSLLSLSLNLGYLSQIGKGAFKTNENVGIYYYSRAVGPDWNGIRTGLTLELSFLRPPIFQKD